MSTYFLLIAVSLLLGRVLYRRYFPVLGIPCVRAGHAKTSTLVIDIRDYNIDADHQSDMRIPHAYLKRFIQEIPKQQLHVVANDRLETQFRSKISNEQRISSSQLSNK